MKTKDEETVVFATVHFLRRFFEEILSPPERQSLCESHLEGDGSCRHGGIL